MTKSFSLSAQNSLSLKDAKSALMIYLNDARRCAEYRYIDDEGSPRPLGIPAMSTALSVLVALGETLIDFDQPQNKKYPTDKECIEKIYPIIEKCSNVSDWYYQSPLSEDEIPNDLWKIRNAIVHAAALPNNVILLPEKDTQRSDNIGCRYIYLSHFIDAVEMTMNSLDEHMPFTPVEKYPDRSLISIVPSGHENSNYADDANSAAGTIGIPWKPIMP